MEYAILHKRGTPVAKGRLMTIKNTHIETEVRKAIEYSESGKDFVMKGGAGSGKTYSMLQFLECIYGSKPEANVACITFTNVAVNEIKNRVPSSNLHVSTIHGFLWSIIKRYQKNIRQSFAALINNGSIRCQVPAPVSAEFWTDPITYKEWLSVENGQISHDELLKISALIFSNYPVLGRILADKYDYLLIDEYQDTPFEVLEIILNILPPPSVRKLRIGFFGDGEQAIYEGGKSKEIINLAVHSGRLHYITKEINRRNPAAIIQIINRLRADGLTQVQAKDPYAPNVGKEGSAHFLYTVENELTSDTLRELTFCKTWNFSSEYTKLLYLGKSMIARENHFPGLMAIYDKDRVVEYAKILSKNFEKKNVAIPEDTAFGTVYSTYQSDVPPTRVMQVAFDEDPSLLTNAFEFRFNDLVSTSVNSDKLIGTKRVSDLDNRDRGEKRDPLINHLISIQEVRSLYKRGEFNRIIRVLDIPIDSIRDREALASNLKSLDSMGTADIGDVMSFAEQTGISVPKDALLRSREKHPYRYSRVIKVAFDEIANLYDYVEDHSPFSTQHGVKGSEWDNIFVSLDTGKWNLFNFEKLLADPESSGSVHVRSRMMLYVACSRAKENLIVYAHSPTTATIERAKEWFGENYVVAVG